MTIQNMGIHIKVADYARSSEFYEALGFQKILELGPDKPFRNDEAGRRISATTPFRGAIFDINGSKLEIADGHPAVRSEVFQESVRSSKISLMIFVNHVSDIIERCKQFNIPLVVGPRHYYWNAIEIVIKDPDGVVLVFIAPYTLDEAELVKADESWAERPAL